MFRQALAKDPATRFPSGEVLVEALSAVLGTQTAAPQRLVSMTQTISLAQLDALRKSDTGSSSTSPTPSDQQRQMTSLYLDVTDVSEVLYESGADTETVRGRMDALWNRFGALAEDHGGVIQSRTDEVGVALWGRDRASEDDSEQAIRTALAMKQAVLEAMRKQFGKDWESTEENPLPFSGGITTGPVLLERDTQSGSYSASGATITLAGRLKDAAPPGEVLVAHETFTLVRGVFTFHPHDPVRVRGRKEPVECYVILSAKPRAFRMKARGIEGVETRMIGREIELRLLEEALTLTLEDGETQVVTVVGEAGIGKSRLLFEFSSLIDLMEQTVWFFQARATQPSMLQPYSLTRDLFSFRFQILDSDNLDTVHDKFVNGVAGFLGEGTEEQAELVGQLVGFDFSDRPAVASALQDPEAFRKRALQILGEFFTTASTTNPVVIQIEDIHWADDASLDLVNHLVSENTRLPLFVICMARPGLYERRPQWGEGQRFHERIQLEPLSQLSSRRLVKEILKRVPQIPTDLRDLVVDRADGNPFYVEELIKALIDDKVIVKGDESWSVDETRLSQVRIPPTLTGVLQSRLDTLPPALHQLLQRVSVVGRIFWDALAVHLSRDMNVQEREVDGMLEELREREMILRREDSSMAGTVEFVFRHAILRDVTYETLVPRQRRALHRSIAEWFLAKGGERAGEQTVRVAEHYALAGDVGLAADQLIEAAEAAARRGAYGEGMTPLKRAMEILKGSPGTETKILSVRTLIGDLHSQQGRFDDAVTELSRVLELGRESDEREARVARVRALGLLARVAMWKDDTATALPHLEEALPLARELDDKPSLIFLLRQMGNLLTDDGKAAKKHIEESLALARETGDRISEANALNSLAITEYTLGDHEASLKGFQESLAAFEGMGDLRGVALSGGNIAETFQMMGRADESKPFVDLVLKTTRENQDAPMHAKALELLGRYHIIRNENPEGRKALLSAMRESVDLGIKPFTGLIQMAIAEAREGSRERALNWIGMVSVADVWQAEELRANIKQAMPEIRGELTDAEVDAALEAGKALQVDAVLQEILAESR